MLALPVPFLSGHFIYLNSLSPRQVSSCRGGHHSIKWSTQYSHRPARAAAAPRPRAGYDKGMAGPWASVGAVEEIGRGESQLQVSVTVFHFRGTSQGGISSMEISLWYYLITNSLNHRFIFFLNLFLKILKKLNEKCLQKLRLKWQKPKMKPQHKS